MTSMEPTKKKPTKSKSKSTVAEPSKQQEFDKYIPVSSNPRVQGRNIQQPDTPQTAMPITKKGSPQAAAPTAHEAAQPMKPTTIELLKDFANVNPQTHLKHTAAQWGYPLGDERLVWGISNKESFDWLYSLSVEERKVARLEHVKAAQMNTQDEYLTLTREDKISLGAQWGISLAAFKNTIPGEAQYQYCRSLPPDQVSVLTRQEIMNLTVVPADTCRARRLQDFTKLTSADKADLKRQWAADDPAGAQRFAAALETAAAFDFFTGLTIPRRQMISPAFITAAREPTKKEWIQQRRNQSTTMLESDWQAVADGWGIDVHDERIVAASDSDGNYQFFCKLNAQQREFITAPEIQARRRPAAGDLKDRQKERRAAAEQETSQRRVAARAAAATRDQHSQVEQQRIALQQTAELDAAFTAAAHAYPKLRRTALAAIRTQVKESNAPHDFDRLARAAWELQRSPTAHGTWLQWMDLRDRDSETNRFTDLTEIPIYDLITERNRMLEAHISLKLASFATDTPTVTDTMTPDQLLDALFKPAPVPPTLATDIMHVTLETWAQNAGGGRSTPHRYWRRTDDASKRYELRTDRNLRWDGQQHTEAAMKQALDQAYDQMLVLLRQRARRVLDDGGFTLRP